MLGRRWHGRESQQHREPGPTRTYHSDRRRSSQRERRREGPRRTRSEL